MPYYQPGDIVLRDYKIEAFIGEGGFGEVYRALDIHLQQSYALKIIRHSLEMDDAYFEKARQRFMLEARLGARLNHPNLIRAVRFAPEETSGLLVLVMEYASGGSLADKIKSDPPLQVSESLQIARQVAAGLSALHAQDVVHRDLKPSNILFDANGVARVADLGLAQPASAVHVGESSSGGGGEFHTSPGTPAYMSPEQEIGKPYLPPSSDIYALGLILFEMLAGRSYKNQPQGTRLSQLRSDIPAALDDLVPKMLSDDPRQRPWDGAAAERALEGISEMSVLTVVSTAPSQSPKWTLEDGLSALKDMVAEQEWQMALDVLEQLEIIYPDHPKLKLPRKKISQTLQAVAESKREADERSQKEAAEKARREVEAKAKREAEERSKREAEARAQSEAYLHPGFLRHSGDRIFIRLDKSQEMEFIHIPAGEFWMGSSPKQDKQALREEQPQHRVTLSEYWIGRAPVTNVQFALFVRATSYRTVAEVEGYGWVWNGQKKEWVRFKGANWQHPRGADSDIRSKPDHPVVQVNWHDAVTYCVWLTKLTSQKIYLPTEAEWEKAARGTDARLYPWGNQPPDARRCNFNSNVKDTTPVSQYSPMCDSPYGCLDMVGSVWEWCADWFASNYYTNAPQASPTGPTTGQSRVVRGGCWNSESRYVRAACRSWGVPGYRFDDLLGFRCILSPAP